MHTYFRWGSTTLYEKHVQIPASIEDMMERSLEFRVAGMPGAIGSMDATHVAMLRCPFNVRQLHKSFKMEMT